MKRITLVIKALYWRTFIAYHALRHVPLLNLGDLVWYQKRQWMLSQGVMAPTWTVRLPGEPTVSLEVHESDLRKVRTLSNYYGSFRSMQRFYMQSWYQIWMMKGVEPWVRACNIWGKHQRARRRA